MKKELIKEKVFSKDYDGIVTGIPFSDLPKDILPTDIIDIEKKEGYYSDKRALQARRSSDPYFIYPDQSGLI